MKLQVYIQPEQYEVLSRLMAATPWPSRFPVSAIDAPGLYYTRRDDIEIKTPAVLILLSHKEYDDAHVTLLGSHKTVILRNNPDRPGWWHLVATE